MRKLFLIGILLLSINATAQKTSVESGWNFQVGLLGSWFNREIKLDSTITFKAEVGFNAGYFTGAQMKNKYGAVPIITAEPRWYYNINKRFRKGKTTENNSSNYLALSLSYIPNWFVISNIDNYKVANQISIVPKWAIRRSFGKSNFNYETGIGVGYRYVFLKEYGYRNNSSEGVIDLHVRFGYTF